jgi:hypothetical protein
MVDAMGVVITVVCFSILSSRLSRAGPGPGPGAGPGPGDSDWRHFTLLYFTLL